MIIRQIYKHPAGLQYHEGGKGSPGKLKLVPLFCRFMQKSRAGRADYPFICRKIIFLAQHKKIKRLSDTWIRLGGVGLFSVNTILNSRTLYADDWLAVLKYIGYNILLIAGLWEGSRFIILQVRKKYSAVTQSRKRVVLTITFTTLYIFFVLFFLLHFFNSKEELKMLPIPMLSVIISSAILSAFIIGIYEALYYFNSLGKVEEEKQELMRINLQGQFDSLKGQVNPHFLFNSLNSLRQLVLKDPPQAARYVEEMSDVYRYLLRNNDGELTTLKNELDFIQSYCHLLKTRFGEGLQVSIEVAGPYMNYCLPPLTLQMLFENSVKHNVISLIRPLHIRVRTDDAGNLVVSNNLQKKMQTIQSEKIGLANIITKYRYLGHPDVAVSETADEFIVTLPLIQKNGL